MGIEASRAHGRLGLLFFFSSRRRHTRCSRDWSSDVCSSDPYTLRVESPKMRSKTPESDLHFVGDANRGCPAHMTVNLSQIIRRKNDLATNAGQRFCDIRCNTTSVSARAVENLRNVTRIFHTRLLVVTAIRAAVIIREGSNVHPRFFSVAPGAVKFVGTDVDDRIGVAVVGEIATAHV